MGFPVISGKCGLFRRLDHAKVRAKGHEVFPALAFVFPPTAVAHRPSAQNGLIIDDSPNVKQDMAVLRASFLPK
jgi:hypothetical protein